MTKARQQTTLKICSVLYNRPIYAKVYNCVCVFLLKGSQFYYYSNTVFDTFVLCLPQYPVLIWSGGWFFFWVLEPDKNDRHARHGGKQRNLYNCPHYIVQHWKATRTLNSSYLHICRYSFAPIPISQSVEGTTSIIPLPYVQMLCLLFFSYKRVN